MLEDSLALSSKAEHKNILWSSNSTNQYLLQETNVCMQ